MASSSPQASATTSNVTRMQTAFKAPLRKGLSLLQTITTKLESIDFSWELGSLKRIYRFEWAAIGLLFLWSAFLLFNALK